MPRSEDPSDRYREIGYSRCYRAYLENVAENFGVAITKSTPQDKIVAMLERVERHLLRYDLCCTPDLEKFVKARELDVVLTKNQKKTGFRRTLLINALLLADEDLKFERLLALPPELRIEIYEYSMADYPEDLDHPTMPPLARTCRQIRTEVLPVFYSTQCFTLKYTYNDSTKGYRMTSSSAIFLMVSDANDTMRYFRRFQLRLRYLSVGISLGGTGRGSDRADIELYNHFNKASRCKLRVGLKALLDEVGKRQDGGVFRMADIQAFKTMIEDTVRTWQD
ncbi:hypothetical protein LTR78_006279 [Recurvomyces mirabilis]|uniref:Uncharacterized protein n=1 Tax=Recurvomyces mirabilis TaxID=574656 RepID=A0AAE0WL42_9PEZI|nr:hypothetical protein LTR78_006279 [Recurvomyces mirabilis]KAK5152168.1 hypothetical protein LTS14_008543 [Recurvomyces mirabilis]